MLEINSLKRSPEVNIKFTLLKQKPILIPQLPIPNIASNGIMALTKINNGIVYGRGVHENTIFRAKLNHDNHQDFISLNNFELVLSPNMYPKTPDGKIVVGYEDPTFVKGCQNPFVEGEDGLLCTQVFPKEKNEGYDTNLVYVGLDKKGYAKPPIAILTPHMLMEYGLAKDIDMVKEGEIFKTSNGKIYLLFEYGGAERDEPKSSNIGIATIANGQVKECRKFYTAAEDESEHISTDSELIELHENIGILFFNRRRNNEWGITYMLINTEELSQREVYPDWVIRAPTNVGLGPGNQLIAFVSNVSLNEDKELEVIYHVNDDSPYQALLRFEKT